MVVLFNVPRAGEYVAVFFLNNNTGRRILFYLPGVSLPYDDQILLANNLSDENTLEFF